MIHLVTYSDENMTISMEKCRASALIQGVGNVYTYKPQIISEEFRRNNDAVLNSSRGAGYWLWKPYIINEVMNFNRDNDLIIYADAGVEFIAPVNEIINRMDEDIFFFTNGFPQIEWCKGDIMRAINGWHNYETFRDKKQVQASVIFFKVNQKTRDFVKEWLLWCQMPGFIDDSPSKVENCKTFAENRHDQACLTAMQIKYGYKLHWWPTQYSEHIRIPGDNYPVIFNHHRKRNNEW
jgi:hypothetical protein